MAMDWAHEVQREAVFPVSITRQQPIGHGKTIPITLAFYDAQHAELDCGNNLTLKIYDPSYKDGKAQFFFEDADGDGITDLRFAATLLPEHTPLNVIFLYRPDGWEKFVLPIAF